jgi:pimeloyl-ACP methyl ester carboxylesterase
MSERPRRSRPSTPIDPAGGLQRKWQRCRGGSRDRASEVNPDGLRRATRMLQSADNRPLLPKLRMPILILTGEMDTDVRPDLKAELLSLTPTTRHVEIPGVGHAPYSEAPQYYSCLIERFLSKEQHQ